MSYVWTRAKSITTGATGMATLATLGALLTGCASAPGAAPMSNPAPAMTGTNNPIGASPASSVGGSTNKAAATKGSGTGGSTKHKNLGGTGGLGGHNNNLGGAAGTGPGYHDSRITLPDTISLSFSRPESTDRTEHEVLSTVQQALRAQLQSENNQGGSSANPLLAMYWTTPALTAAQHEMATWLKKGKHPVGVLVITDTAYTPPDASGKSIVTYCANWSHTYADKANARETHGATPPASTPSAAPTTSGPGSYTTLTLAQADKHHWQVQNLAASAKSPNCSGADTAATAE